MSHGLNKKINFPSSANIEGFSEREAVALIQIGKIRKADNGEHLIRQGEKNAALIKILEGSFKILNEKNNTDVFAAIGLNEDWFGNPDITKDIENRFSVISSGPSRVLEIDRYAFNLLTPDIQIKVCRKIIDTSTRLADELIAHATVLSEKVISLATYSQRSHDKGRDKYLKSVLVQDMITSFPRLPIQINRLTSMLLDEGAAVSDIVGFAKMDPSIVSVVLKTVNSGYYNFQRKISDFHHAFVLLGFNQVYQILMENFLQGIMPKHFNLKELNLHSAVISQIAFDIAHLSNKSKPVTMSTLGILHDIGKCVVLVSKDKRTEMDLVLTRLDDSKIGSLLLNAWNTPAIICRSVEYQTYPMFSPAKEIPEDCRENTAILHVAHLCFDYLCGQREEKIMQAFSEEYMDILDIGNYSIENLVNQYILPSLTRKVDVFPDYVRDFISNKNTSAQTFQPI